MPLLLRCLRLTWLVLMNANVQEGVNEFYQPKLKLIFGATYFQSQVSARAFHRERKRQTSGKVSGKLTFFPFQRQTFTTLRLVDIVVWEKVEECYLFSTGGGGGEGGRGICKWEKTKEWTMDMQFKRTKINKNTSLLSSTSCMTRFYSTKIPGINIHEQSS